MARTAVVTVYIGYESDNDGILDQTLEDINALHGVIETDFVDDYED